MSENREIWVIEMRCSSQTWRTETFVWLPTVAAGLSYPDARFCLADLRKKNPDDLFRIRRYRAARDAARSKP